MKKVTLFFLWSGMFVSALFGITSAVSNIMLTPSLFSDASANKYTYMFLFGRWSFTFIMAIAFFILKRLKNKYSL